MIKCEFCMAVIDYLGFQLDVGKIRPGALKVKTLLEFSRPDSKKSVQSFLGLCNFFNRFIPNYSLITLPLTNLLKKNSIFVWNESAERAYVTLKCCMCKSPVLATPKFDRPYTIFVDSSDKTIGVCMTQADDEGNLHPVLYLSRKLNIHQSRYPTTLKEAYAIVTAAKLLSVYLENSFVHTVYTDHDCLTYLKRTSGHNQTLLRWSIFLSQFNLKVISIPGNRQIADFLSRPTSSPVNV
jgi:hypothetical protein